MVLIIFFLGFDVFFWVLSPELKASYNCNIATRLNRCLFLELNSQKQKTKPWTQYVATKKSREVIPTGGLARESPLIPPQFRF